MIAGSSQHVKEYWQERARAPAADNALTHPDVWQRWLEIELIRQYVGASDRLIDVGCGNGYTIRQMAPRGGRTVGIDYSEEMIDAANRSLEASKDDTGNITFAVHNVLELSPESFGLFDVAISERCLINLSSRMEQQQAIARIASLLSAGGRFLLVEGTADGRRRLNDLRESVGLERMPQSWHNLDLGEAELLRCVDRYFVVERHQHLEAYDLVSRVAHPLMVAPDTPDYEAPINEAAARMSLHHPGNGDVSRVIFLVLRKRP